MLQKLNGQSRMNNPEKLGTLGTQDEDYKKTTKQTQYVLDITMHLPQGVNYSCDITVFTSKIFQGFYKFRCVRNELFSFVIYVGNTILLKFSNN